MKKHILLFVLMSSVLTSSALAIMHPQSRNGDCLLKKMANDNTLESGGKTAFIPQRVASSSSMTAVKSKN